MLTNPNLAAEGVICIRGTKLVQNNAVSGLPNEIQFDGSQSQRADLDLVEDLVANTPYLLTYEIFEATGGVGAYFFVGGAKSANQNEAGVHSETLTASYAMADLSARAGTGTVARIGNIALEAVE